MSHKVDVEGLLSWRSKVTMQFASSHGRGANKVLSFTATGEYEVEHNDNVVLKTGDAKKAVDKYNELP